MGTSPGADSERKRRGAVDEARSGESRRTVVVSLMLAAATFLVYAQACGFDWVLIDDPIYVTRNLNVQRGLTPRNVVWSFTSTIDGNWIPLTCLSLMLDSDVYGPHPGGFHFTNVLLHTVNTIVLFAFLLKATGQRGPSAFVAALFALHPLHVESVAWISERKDVLSIFFGLLALLAYVHYGARPGFWRLATAFVLFVASMLAKSTLVTLPFLLLLLDYWPLRRFSFGGRSLSRVSTSAPPDAPPDPPPAANDAAGPSDRDRTSLAAPRPALWLLMEKVPFLVVSAVVAVVTLFAQAGNDAVQNLTALPLSTRLGNAAVVYVAYLAKTFFPHNLAVYYPHPEDRLGWQLVWGATAILAAVSASAVVVRRRLPYLAVGWAWYVGTLVPMIGLVQVGSQQMADRYTYFPLIGVFIALVWTLERLVNRFVPAGALRTRVVPALGCVALSALAAASFRQIAYWRDDVALFTHAVAAAADNAFTRNKLGCALLAQGKLSESIDQLQTAARLDPREIHPQYNLGVALAQAGRPDEAAAHYRAALAINDAHATAHNNLALIEGDLGHYQVAKAHLRRAIEISPDYAQASMNLGLVCLQSRDYGGAIANCQHALELDPGLLNSHRIIARALQAQGRTAEAIARLQYVLTIAPGDAGARTELARLFAGSPAPAPAPAP